MNQACLPGISTLKVVPRPEDWRPDEPPSLVGIDEVAVDFETTGLRWWERDRPVGVAVGWLAGNRYENRYLPWAHEGGGNLDEARVREWFSTELRGKKVINLNTKFDAHMGRAWGLDLREIAGSLGDVGHYAALLDDHRRRFNLDGLGKDYLGEGKVEGLDMSGGAQRYPAWMVTPYARKDTELVIRLMERMRPLLAAEEQGRVMELEDRVIPATIEMEANGCPLDVELLRQWERESEVVLEEQQRALDRAAGWPVAAGSPDHMTRLFRQCGIETPERTESGALSYSDAVVSAFAKTHPLINLVREVKKTASMRSKFLVAYLNAVGGDGIMRYGLNQLRSDEGGTVSGRYSSSALVRDGRPGCGVNIQQVMSVSKQKKKHGDRWIIRDLYRAPEGRLFLAADAKQIEFRLFVHLSNSQRLIAAYERDRETDFHAFVADMVQTIRPDFQRKDVKMLNFEQLYGGGIGRTAELLGCSEAVAKSFVKSYDQAFPEARTILRKAYNVAESRGYVFTLLGRRTRFPERKRLHKALNGVIQGGAADINKLKLAELYEQRRDLGLVLRMTVHDEVCGDVADEEAARRVAAVLDQQAVPLRVPILWDANWGATWGDCA